MPINNPNKNEGEEEIEEIIDLPVAVKREDVIDLPAVVKKGQLTFTANDEIAALPVVIPPAKVSDFPIAQEVEKVQPSIPPSSFRRASTMIGLGTIPPAAPVPSRKATIPGFQVVLTPPDVLPEPPEPKVQLSHVSHEEHPIQLKAILPTSDTQPDSKTPIDVEDHQLQLKSIPPTPNESEKTTYENELFPDLPSINPPNFNKIVRGRTGTLQGVPKASILSPVIQPPASEIKPSATPNLETLEVEILSRIPLNPNNPKKGVPNLPKPPVITGQKYAPPQILPETIAAFSASPTSSLPKVSVQSASVEMQPVKQEVQQQKVPFRKDILLPGISFDSMNKEDKSFGAIFTRVVSAYFDKLADETLKKLSPLALDELKLITLDKLRLMIDGSGEELIRQIVSAGENGSADMKALHKFLTLGTEDEQHGRQKVFANDIETKFPLIMEEILREHALRASKERRLNRQIFHETRKGDSLKRLGQKVAAATGFTMALFSAGQPDFEEVGGAVTHLSPETTEVAPTTHYVPSLYESDLEGVKDSQWEEIIRGAFTPDSGNKDFSETLLALASDGASASQKKELKALLAEQAISTYAAYLEPFKDYTLRELDDILSHYEHPLHQDLKKAIKILGKPSKWAFHLKGKPYAENFSEETLNLFKGIKNSAFEYANRKLGGNLNPNLIESRQNLSTYSSPGTFLNLIQRVFKIRPELYNQIPARIRTRLEMDAENYAKFTNPADSLINSNHPTEPNKGTFQMLPEDQTDPNVQEKHASYQAPTGSTFIGAAEAGSYGQNLHNQTQNIENSKTTETAQLLNDMSKDLEIFDNRTKQAPNLRDSSAAVLAGFDQSDLNEQNKLAEEKQTEFLANVAKELLMRTQPVESTLEMIGRETLEVLDGMADSKAMFQKNQLKNGSKIELTQVEPNSAEEMTSIDDGWDEL